MSLPRGMRLPKGATKLWWADASFYLVQRVLHEVRAEIPRQNGSPAHRLGWNRRVSKRFLKRLKAMGIYVEGA